MEREQAIKLMHDLLRRMVEKKASDLFITAGFPPAIKIDGEIRPQSRARADAPSSRATLVRAIMNDKQTDGIRRAPRNATSRSRRRASAASASTPSCSRAASACVHPH